jgi:hypothetical protein
MRNFALRRESCGLSFGFRIRALRAFRNNGRWTYFFGSIGGAVFSAGAGGNAGVAPSL